MRKLRLGFSALLILLVLIFVIQNVATVEVQFLIWSLPIPRSLLIFSVLAIGVIIGWIFGGALRRKRP